MVAAGAFTLVVCIAGAAGVLSLRENSVEAFGGSALRLVNAASGGEDFGAGHHGIIAPGEIVQAHADGVGTSFDSVAESECEQVLSNRSVILRTHADGRTHRACVTATTADSISFVVPNTIDPAKNAEVDVAVVAEASDEPLASTTVVVASVAPGLATADGSGRGRVAGEELHAMFGQLGPAAPLGDELHVADDGSTLIRLVATGVRGLDDVRRADVVIGDVVADVVDIQPNPLFAGVDQVLVRLPRVLAERRGEVAVVLTIQDERGERYKSQPGVVLTLG